MRSTCSSTLAAYRKKASPWAVGTMPLGVRRKISIPRLSSSSRMALLKLGWAINSSSAAWVMEPVRATVTAY